MSALKPIERRKVRAVESASYPSNLTCAHPECTEKVQLRPDGTPTVHHCFPRSQTKSASYFVVVTDDDGFDSAPIPHAVGLCGSGTTGHHGDVEDHRSWIKYEEGVWNWYERRAADETSEVGGVELHIPYTSAFDDEWVLVGPLNPQPGSVEGKPKRRKLVGEARRARANWQVRVPADAEDGAAILDELSDACWQKVHGNLPVDEGTQYTRLAAIFAWVMQNG